MIASSLLSLVRRVCLRVIGYSIKSGLLFYLWAGKDRSYPIDVRLRISSSLAVNIKSAHRFLYMRLVLDNPSLSQCLLVSSSRNQLAVLPQFVGSILADLLR